MAKGKKEETLTPEERLQAALVPDWEQPYKVPENWCWTKIGILSTLHRGVSYKKQDAHTQKGSQDCLILRGGNILEGRIQTEDSDNVYVDQHLVQEEQLVRLYDIIIVSSTGSKKVIGRAGVSAETYGDVAFGAFLTLVRPKSELMRPFIGYYFQSDLYRERIQNLATGVNINNIRTEYITESPVPFPPLPEQQRIVDRIEILFAKLDEAKEKAQATLDSFEARKAAILHKAFTGELTAQWRKERHAAMEDWEVLELRNVCEVNPPKLDTKNLPDDLDVSFYPMASVSETYGEITEPQVRLLKDVRTGFTNFSEGDVVFAKITPCMENGKSAIIGQLVNNIGYGTTEFFVLRCGDQLYNRYLYHMVRDRNFRNKAKAVMTGAVGQQRVPKSFLETYRIHLPPVSEQTEIVRILDDILTKEQQAKEAAETVLEQIDLIKKSILARAFRGELGTNDPSEESAVELIKQTVLETISEDKTSQLKKKAATKSEVIRMPKTMIEALSGGVRLTPENLKFETGLQIDDFYDQLKKLIDQGQVIETRMDGESYLEATNANR